MMINLIIKLLRIWSGAGIRALLMEKNIIFVSIGVGVGIGDNLVKFDTDSDSDTIPDR